MVAANRVQHVVNAFAVGFVFDDGEKIFVVSIDWASTLAFDDAVL